MLQTGPATPTSRAPAHRCPIDGSPCPPAGDPRAEWVISEEALWRAAGWGWVGCLGKGPRSWGSHSPGSPERCGPTLCSKLPSIYNRDTCVPGDNRKSRGAGGDRQSWLALSPDTRTRVALTGNVQVETSDEGKQCRKTLEALVLIQEPIFPVRNGQAKKGV